MRCLAHRDVLAERQNRSDVFYVLKRAHVAIALGETDGDVATLAGALDDLGVTLRALLGDLRASGLELGDASGALLRGATARGASSGDQVQAMRRASANAESLVEVTRHAAREAESVIDMTHRAETLSGEGLAAVEQAVRSSGALGEQVRRIAATMSDLSERTLQVGEIVTTVKDLAEQSNLLAFNASIEAARSGEHGRGFAAVAMEMRNLAEQSRQAAVQVRSILGEIQKHAREAALATEEGSTRAALATGRSRSAGQAIEGLAVVIRDSAGTARAIADRTRERSMHHDPAEHEWHVAHERAAKDVYFRTSPHSPIAPSERPSFEGLAYYAIDPGLRFEGLRLIPLSAGEEATIEIATSDGGTRLARRLGSLEFVLGQCRNRRPSGDPVSSP